MSYRRLLPLSPLTTPYDSDWESMDAILTVDGSALEHGPRITIRRTLPSDAL